MVTPEPRSPVPGAPVLAEVVARMGERVVDVQHLGVEPEPAVSPAGWCTIGACAMVLGLGLLVAGVAAGPPPVDPTVDAALEPAPPARGGPAGLGFLLLLLGVIPVVIGLRPRAVPRDRYMIGEGPDVHLPVALPGARDGLALVRALERQVILGLVPGMTGEIRDGEQRTALVDLLAQGRSSYALPAGATCEAELGGLRFTVQATERAALEPAKRSLDRLYFASNLGALALIGGALLLGEPREAGELAVEEVAASRERAVRYLTDVPPPPPPPPSIAPPPVPRDRPSRTAEKPPPPPPQPTIDTLATEVVDDGKAQIVPKGTKRGIRDDFDYARTAGFLNDPAFNESVERATADAQEGLLKYDNEADHKMWAAVLAAPVIDRPFGGLTLAETERGGGLHDDRPKPAKAPAKRIEIDANAKPEGPSAEARALARRIVKIDFARPYVRGEGLDPDTVQAGVRKHEVGLRNCFKAAVGFTDKVGTIFLKLKVSGRGKVTSATIDFSGARLGAIGACIEKDARGWKFPEPHDRQPVAIVIEGLFSVKDY
jgi:hypothetical protein